MEKLITMDNLRNFAYVNDRICPKPIRGIMLHFPGLGFNLMYGEETKEGMRYAEEGILYVVPYNNPWNWMNRQSIAFTEELLELLIAHYGLGEHVPIVSSGLSMGGLCSLVFCRYARRTPVACVSNCPVCDFVFHYTERPDLPRTIYSAFFHESGTLDEVLRRYSPLHLVPELPDIPYYIFHCGADAAVNIHVHTEAFVKAMEQRGARITFETVPDRGHCDLTPEAVERYHSYAIRAIRGNCVTSRKEGIDNDR